MWLSRVDVSIDKCVIQSSLLSGFSIPTWDLNSWEEKKKIIAHGASRWRERRRTLVQCELQWGDFIDKQLKDATTWKLLRNSGYLELMRK